MIYQILFFILFTIAGCNEFVNKTSPANGNGNNSNLSLNFTNEPAGLTVLADHDWSAWNADWQNEVTNPTGYAHIVSDASAPKSPNGVLEQLYANGMSGGTAPANVIFWNTNGYTEVFVGIWYKMSANYEGYPGGTNKLMNIWTPVTIQWLRVNAYGAHDNDGDRQNGPFYLVATNGSGGSDLIQNQVPQMIPIQPGKWHKIEWHLILPSGGLDNGRMRWWLDETLLGDYQNYTSAQLGNVLQEFQISPTWGGGAGPVTTRDSSMRFDHIRISVR